MTDNRGNPLVAKLALTPNKEEAKVLAKCQENAVIRGAIYSAGFLGVSALFIPRMISKERTLLRRGAYTVLGLTGFVQGVASYSTGCMRMLMALDDSPMAEELRKVMAMDEERRDTVQGRVTSARERMKASAPGAPAEMDTGGLRGMDNPRAAPVYGSPPPRPDTTRVSPSDFDMPPPAQSPAHTRPASSFPSSDRGSASSFGSLGSGSKYDQESRWATMPKASQVHGGQGDYSKEHNSGDYSKEHNSGDYSKEHNSGDYSKEHSGGDYNKEHHGGDYSNEHHSDSVRPTDMDSNGEVWAFDPNPSATTGDNNGMYHDDEGDGGPPRKLTFAEIRDRNREASQGRMEEETRKRREERARERQQRHEATEARRQAREERQGERGGDGRRDA